MWDPGCLGHQSTQALSKYDLAYPDFPGLHALVPLRYKRMKPNNFVLEREDPIAWTTTSGVRIVSTRIRKFIFSVEKASTQARPGTRRGAGSKEMLTTTDVGRGRLLRGTLLVTLLSAGGLLAYSVARTPRGESVGPTPDPSHEWSACAALSGVVPGNLASYGQVLQHATAAALRATSATLGHAGDSTKCKRRCFNRFDRSFNRIGPAASSCGSPARAERAESVAVGSSWRHCDSHYASAHLWSCMAPGLIVICCITALGAIALASKWQRTAPEAGMPSKRGFAFLCAQHLPAPLLAMISPPLPKQADNLPAGVRGENSHNSSDCHAFHSVCTPMNGAM